MLTYDNFLEGLKLIVKYLKLYKNLNYIDKRVMNIYPIHGIYLIHGKYPIDGKYPIHGIYTLIIAFNIYSITSSIFIFMIPI